MRQPAQQVRRPRTASCRLSSILGALIAATLATGAHAESCRLSMPTTVEEMTLEDIACYFVDDMRAYRTMEATVVLEGVNAGLAGVNEGLDGQAARDVDVNDVDSLIDYHELKEDERGHAVNAQAAAQRAGTVAAQMDALVALIQATPHFARYQELLGLTSSRTAFRMLNEDAKKLWNQSEKRERKLERKRAREIRKGL